MSKKVLTKTPKFYRSDLNEMVSRCIRALLDLMGIIYGSNAEIIISVKPDGVVQFNLVEECADKTFYMTHYQDGEKVSYEESEVKKGVWNGRVKD